MKYLVTGGSGLIGTALCNKLLNKGHQVVSFDNFSRQSHLKEDCKYETYVGDIRIKQDLQDCINKYSCFDGIWHLAYINRY